MKNFFFFGDSICFGQGISLHKSWVVKLSEYIEKQLPDIQIINSSKNGDTTRTALERMPYDVQSHGIDYIVIQFGINDANYWETDKGLPRVSRQSFESNLIEIIERALYFGAKKVILNTNHTLEKHDIFPNTNINLYESCSFYNNTIRRVAYLFKGKAYFYLNDIELYIEQYLKLMKKNNDYILLPDGIHLNQAGHDIYTVNMINFLKEKIF